MNLRSGLAVALFLIFTLESTYADSSDGFAENPALLQGLTEIAPKDRFNRIQAQLFVDTANRLKGNTMLFQVQHGHFIGKQEDMILDIPYCQHYELTVEGEIIEGPGENHYIVQKVETQFTNREPCV